MMKHHIVFLDRSTLIATIRSPDFLHEWTEYQASTPDEICERLKNASIAISNKAVLCGEIIDRLPKLRMVAIAATGTNNIDIEHCRARGITVCNIRDYAQFSVSEHAIALALTLRRNLTAYRRDLRARAWENAPGFCLLTHPISDLWGSVLGIVGYGAIGRRTAEIGQALGMKVQVAEHRGARTIRPDRVTFEQVVRQSDVLSVHCPLNEETKGLIGAEELTQMKSSAIVINTARGGIVDEDALVSALQSGTISGAGIDVLTTEPPTEGNALLELDLPQLIITPHIGWASKQAMQILADQLIDNIEAYVQGRPQNIVA